MNRFLLSAAAVALSAGMANAAIVVAETDVRSIGFDPTELGGTLSFDGFQGAGTVVEVMVTFFGEIDGTITLTNNGGNTENFTATTNSQFFFSSTDVTVPGAPQVTASGGTAGLTSIDPDETLIIPVAGDDELMDTIVGPGIVPFLSPFDIDIATLTGLTLLGGGGNLANSQSTDAFARVTVEYKIDDTPPPPTIPLPASLPLLLGALGGLGFLSWRKRQS